MGEPNSSSNQAYTISENGSLEALIGYGSGNQVDYEDWYRLTVSSNGTLAFTLTNLHPAGVEGGRIGVSELYNAGLQYVISNFSLPVPVTGGEVYYFRVIRYDNHHAAPYRLESHFTPTTAIMDLGEPNDGSTQAHTISETGTIEALIGYGSSSQVDTEDWYRLTVPANGTLQFTVTNLHERGIRNGDMGFVELFNAGFQRLSLVSSNTLNPGEQGTSTPVAVTTGEVYYLKVKPYFTHHAAPYRLETTFSSD